MAIDLSRLDISLDKFNAESSGTYNIGHLKLSSDGTSVVPYEQPQDVYAL